MVENNSGIYKWTNLVNGKIYIGQSSNLKKRKSRFLNFNLEYSGEYINNSRLKYPSGEYWKYDIIEYCNVEELDNRETYYINLYNSTDKSIGYNLCKGGNGTRGFSPWNKGLKWTDDIKNKISETLKGTTSWCKGLTFSKDYRNKLSESHKGKKHTDEQKKKISESIKGEKSYMYGKPKSEEIKNKIRLTKSKKVYQIEKGTGIIIKEWESATQASKELKITKSGINECCNNKRKTAGGFIWKFVS